MPNAEKLRSSKSPLFPQGFARLCQGPLPGVEKFKMKKGSEGVEQKIEKIKKYIKVVPQYFYNFYDINGTS